MNVKNVKTVKSVKQLERARFKPVVSSCGAPADGAADKPPC